MPISQTPAFKPAVPPVQLGAAGTVLTSNGPTAATPPTFQAPFVTPTLIQSAFTRTLGDPTGTVTLPDPPTPGNFLIGMATGFDNEGGVGNQVGLPLGFALINGDRYITGDQGIAVGIRLVQSGDGTDWLFSGGNGGDTYGLLELTPVHNITAFNSVPLTDGFVMLFGAAGVPVGGFTFGIVESDSTNAFASIAGATLLFDGTNVGSNHPAVIFQVLSMGSVEITYSTTTAFGLTAGMLITVV